jgi:hypothetical protein
MAFKDMLSLCSRIGLIMAAFAFVAGIIAGPLLEKVWAPRLTVTEQSSPPVPLPPKALTEPQSDKQG